MQTYSTTQGNNIVIFAGLLSIILAKFNISIGSEEIQGVIGMILALIGTIMQYVHRYKQGDLTLGGFHKD